MINVLKKDDAAYRSAVDVALVAAFILVWLSLGIIGEGGGPANLMYFVVLAVGIISALIARFRPLLLSRRLVYTHKLEGRMDHAHKRERRLAGIARRAAVAGLLVLALGVGEAEVAVAQAWGRFGAGAGYVSMGVSGTATGELDDRLAARGYPTFGRTTQALGIGAYWILPGGVMLGGEWNGLTMGEEAHEGRTVGLSGGYATLSIGYALKLTPRVRVYPRLGLGGGGFGLWIREEGGDVGFDEVLADPDGYVDDDPDDLTVLDRDGMVVDLGAGAELLPGGRGRGLLVGLRLGYLAAPSHSDWGLVDRRTVSRGPDATLAGPYVRLVVGGTIGGR